MSQFGQQSVNQQIKILFQNKKLTGFDIAKNNEIATLVKRDSTDFANEIIHHERGREIICELIDTVLRPQTLIDYLAQKKQQKPQKQSKHQSKNQQIQSNQDKITIFIYNAIQILTNQYEQFVQYVFQQQKNDSNLQQKGIDRLSPPSSPKNIDQKNAEFGHSGNQKHKQHQLIRQPELMEEDLQDCVIMDSHFPQLTKNSQDSVLKKINDMSKLTQTDIFKCVILERMFLLFQQPAPIQETPVSYFNKIMLQFVYQRPQQIMRFFYCDKQAKEKPSISCQRIKKIASHLYNNSVVELLIHIMQLQSDGNFFIQQKIQILNVIVEEVFKYEEKAAINKKQENNDQFSEELSTVSDLVQSKIQHYVLFLKGLNEKLQDRYQQEKFMPIFKYHLNDQKLLQKIIDYFFYHFNIFDMSGLLKLLLQTLKMDQVNFKLHKLATQNISPFGNAESSSLHNKNQESSVTSYDLKLSKEVLDQIEKVISKLSQKYEQWQGSTMRMVEFYQLLSSWLHVTVKDRQSFAKNILFTPSFINDCVYKIQSHPNSNILQNSIKNIFVDFLPKINQSIKLVLAPGCRILSFIQRQLQEEKYAKKNKFKKKKCFENQLYHIGKTILSMWQQHKMLHMIKKTQQDQIQEKSQNFSQEPTSPTSDGENIIRLQNLKILISQKQQFYEHLICGDPRKMGQYQQEESSQIIMTSSFKNFFKPSFGNGPSQATQNTGKVVSGNKRYGEESQLGFKDEMKQKQEIQQKKENETKPKRLKNLRIGDEQAAGGNSIFQSVISPLNANRSHTFNFDFDALPLDSDNSEQVESQEENLSEKNQGSGQVIEQQMKLMQQNIQNLQILRGNVFNVQSNILSSNHSRQNDKNLLTFDNYRRQQLCKSMQISDNQIQKVDSYLEIYSPRKQSQDAISLGLDSKQSQSKISDENKGSKIQTPSIFIKQQSFLKEQSVIRRDSQLFQSPVLIKIETKEQELEDINFVKHYSSYLEYDIDKLFAEVQEN